MYGLGSGLKVLSTYLVVANRLHALLQVRLVRWTHTMRMHATNGGEVLLFGKRPPPNNYTRSPKYHSTRSYTHAFQTLNPKPLTVNPSDFHAGAQETSFNPKPYRRIPQPTVKAWQKPGPETSSCCRGSGLKGLGCSL